MTCSEYHGLGLGSEVGDDDDDDDDDAS